LGCLNNQTSDSLLTFRPPKNRIDPGGTPLKI